MMNNQLHEENLIYENERIDDLQCNGYKIIQNPSYFCFGMDAVLLANFVAVKKKARVIDLGTGTGIIPLLLAAKEKGCEYTALEIQKCMVDMAGRSVRLNNISDKMKIIEGNICNIKDIFKAASFETVTSNPPYIRENHGLCNPDIPINVARHEILLTLEDVISAASYLLVPGGNFAMVHKPFRIPEIMSLMKKYKLEPKRMQLVQPYFDKEPNMVLIEASKCGNPMLKVMPTLVVYNKDGTYTKELLSYYENKSE